MRRCIEAFVVTLLLGLASPCTAWAATVTFFSSPLDDGTPSAGIPAPLMTGVNDINLFADPTAAPGGGVFGVATVLLETFGDVFITGASCTATDCIFVPVSPMQLLFTGGDVINGEFDVFRIGDVQLSVMGAGGFQLTTGSTLSADFSDTVIDGPRLIASTGAVPEPAPAALLALALLALAVPRLRLG